MMVFTNKGLPLTIAIVAFLAFNGFAQHRIAAKHYVPLSRFDQEKGESIYKQKINIAIRNAPFGDALEQIARLGNIRLSYDEKQLPDRNVTLMIRNA